MCELAPSTQHPAPSTQHPAPSTQHPAPSTQHSALSTQHSALSTQHSALSTRTDLHTLSHTLIYTLTLRHLYTRTHTGKSAPYCRSSWCHPCRSERGQTLPSASGGRSSPGPGRTCVSSPPQRPLQEGGHSTGMH
ncbi:hypothetical protein COCON_G00086530, partial [Conger conger]